MKGPEFGNVQDAAAYYTERGFRVIPLYGVDASGRCQCPKFDCKDRDAGKHTAPETEEAWKAGQRFEPWAFPLGSNIALAMGPWRRDRWLVALDLDGTSNPADFFPSLPATLTAETPRGGRHLVFSVRERAPLGNWVDVFKTKSAGFSLDLRYARGRIVVAPSRGAEGHYRWIDWREPAPLPEAAISSILAMREQLGLPVSGAWDRGEKMP